LINGYIQSSVILENIESYIVSRAWQSLGYVGCHCAGRTGVEFHMILDPSLEREARKSLQRLLPRVEQTLKKEISKDKPGWKQFNARLQKNFPALISFVF
jgi:hypothetical protein